MDPSPLHPSLLRPPILHILRAAGFTTTRPSVLDTLVDLTSRYLTLLATNTARHAALRQPSSTPSTITLTDVRLALQDAGAFHPSISEMEQQVLNTEDLRGIDAFISWCQGESNLEIRRIAGMAIDASPATAMDLAGNSEAAVAAAETVAAEQEARNLDYLTQLKRKHAKTKDGEESRYAGTVLGRDREEGEVRIEGWEVGSLEGWGRMLREKYRPKEDVVEMEREAGSGSGSESPLSEISGVTAV